MNSKQQKTFYLLCVLILPLFFAGCATLEEGGVFSNLNLISTQEEVELGERFAAEVEKQEAVSTDAALQAYVREVGARIARVAPRQDIPYTFTVIDAPDTVNAFALPGGHTYFYTGLMKVCENEAEMAAVMAHEIGHVSAHHHGEMITRQMGMQTITDIILGENPHAAASLVTQLFSSGIAARFSRVQEREADRLGMEMLYRAGYQPEAMISFMNKLLAYDQQQGGSHGLPIFATHPTPGERVQLLQGLIQQYPLDQRQQRQVGTERYKTEVLSRVQ